jgi:hypothetical protein
MWQAVFIVLAIGLMAMVVVVAGANRRSRSTISKERAQREGLLGQDGLDEAQRRHDTDARS